MPPTQTHSFACPHCGRTIELDDAMKATLVQTGCVVCGSPVTETAFTPLTHPNTN